MDGTAGPHGSLPALGRAAGRRGSRAAGPGSSGPDRSAGRDGRGFVRPSRHRSRRAPRPNGRAGRSAPPRTGGPVRRGGPAGARVGRARGGDGDGRRRGRGVHAAAARGNRGRAGGAPARGWGCGPVRIERIRIDAFGRLSGFDSGEAPLSRLVVMLGPNEAGKSTIFQFLTTILYGFKPASRE